MKVKKLKQEGNSDSYQMWQEIKIFYVYLCRSLFVKESQVAEFLDAIKFQKWSKMLSFDEGLYEAEMSEFCSNFENNEGLCIIIVYEKLVKYNAKKISELFDVSNEGYKDYIKGREKLNDNGASNATILGYFGGSATYKSLAQKYLPPFHILLFQLVWCFILPITSKRTQASLMDLSLMFCMAKNIKINSPSLRISHLSYYISHNNKIGYGNLVSTILKNCQVKLPSSPSFELEPENFLTKDTQSRLSLRV